jgi:integrase/recombinase XerD
MSPRVDILDPLLSKICHLLYTTGQNKTEIQIDRDGILAIMELFFADDPLSNRRPFILDREMIWLPEVNHFLHSVAEENGKTASPHTSRAYGYHLIDWLSYTEEVGLDWKRASQRQLATYRNALARDNSILTRRPLKRETINLRLGMICTFYKFMVRQQYISKLPFEVQDIRVRIPRDQDEMAHLRAFAGKRTSNTLMYRTHERSLEIPNNENVREFIRTFKSWRNRLMAELMWVSGLRRSEVCGLTVFIMPESLNTTKDEFVVISVKGKGAKYRNVKLPIRLLRSVSRYIETDRSRLLKRSGTKTDQIWLGQNGRAIKPAAINKAFATNERDCGLKVSPHTLRHSYAVNRLRYLQDRKINSALKILQGELGHAHLSTTQIYLHETDMMRSEVVAQHAGFIESLHIGNGE